MMWYITISQLDIAVVLMCGIFSILPLDMAAVLMVWYITILPLDMAALLMVWNILCFVFMIDIRHYFIQ